MHQVTFKLMRNIIRLRIAFHFSIKYSGSTRYINKRCWKKNTLLHLKQKIEFFLSNKKKRKWGRCSLSFFLSNGRRKIGKKKKTNVNWKQEWTFANQCWSLYYKTRLKRMYLIKCEEWRRLDTSVAKILKMNQYFDNECLRWHCLMIPYRIKHDYSCLTICGQE